MVDEVVRSDDLTLERGVNLGVVPLELSVKGEEGRGVDLGAVVVRYGLESNGLCQTVLGSWADLELLRCRWRRDLPGGKGQRVRDDDEQDEGRDGAQDEEQAFVHEGSKRRENGWVSEHTTQKMGVTTGIYVSTPESFQRRSCLAASAATLTPPSAVASVEGPGKTESPTR